MREPQRQRLIQELYALNLRVLNRDAGTHELAAVLNEVIDTLLEILQDDER